MSHHVKEKYDENMQYTMIEVEDCKDSTACYRNETWNG